MKYTLADCVVTINQILNYPSVDYSDITYFFDQAISELNTELHLGLKPISEVYKKSTFNLEDLGDVVFFDAEPKATVSTNPNDIVHTAVEDNTRWIFYKNHNDESAFKKVKVLYGVYAKYHTNPNTGAQEISKQLYQTVILGGNAYWTPYEIMPDRELDLLNYMPMDWINLFLIPYVCFKYALRNGDAGVAYAEDFQNGFQQLRNSYDIPCFVVLSEQAGKEAYNADVKENLPHLNIQIPTRAIYDSMKTERVLKANYGNNMYDTGGWGV